MFYVNKCNLVYMKNYKIFGNILTVHKKRAALFRTAPSCGELTITLIFVSAFYHGCYHFELLVSIKTMSRMSWNNDAIA